MVDKATIELINMINKQKKYFNNFCNVAGAEATNMNKEEAYRLSGINQLDIAEIKDAIMWNKLNSRDDYSSQYEEDKLKRIAEHEKRKYEDFSR